MYIPASVIIFVFIYCYSFKGHFYNTYNLNLRVKQIFVGAYTNLADYEGRILKESGRFLVRTLLPLHRYGQIYRIELFHK